MKPPYLGNSIHYDILGSKLDDGLFFVLVGIIAWLPLYYGGDRELVWNINLWLFTVIITLYELRIFLTIRQHPVDILKFKYAVFGVVITASWILIQSSTLLPKLFQNPIYEFIGQRLSTDILGSISVNRPASSQALCRLITCMEAFWVSTQLCHNRARSNQIVYAICLIGAAYSVFGIANHYFEPNWILFDSKFYYLDSVTSTFVNRNSFATYAGIALVANLSVLFAAFRHVSERNIHPFIRIIAAITGLPGIWLSMSFLVGISLVMTGSRGGVLSFIFGAIAIGIIGLLRKKGHVSSSIWILVMASLMLSTVAFYFSGFLESRFLVHGLESSDRVAVYRLTLISIRDEPWLGFGYGTFQYVFPWYLDSTIAAGDFWDRAHNTYLEVFQGLGIPVATIYLLSLGALALRCARGAVRRHAFATAPTVAAGATVIVATHSLVDFSMQVQSIALTWSLLLGAGVAQSWNRSNTKNSSENGSKSNQR